MCQVCAHGTYLASALGAAVHRPLGLVLVHNTIVDANAPVHLQLSYQLLAIWSLRGEKGESGGGEERALLEWGWKTLTLPRFQYKWITDPHRDWDIGRAQTSSNSQNIFEFSTWDSLRLWPVGCRRSDKWLCSGKLLTGSGGKIRSGEDQGPLTTLLSWLASCSTTMPSPLNSLNMPAMSLHVNPQTDWISTG